MHPLSRTAKHRGRAARDCKDIVITRPEVHDAELTVLACCDISKRSDLWPVVFSDVDFCIRKWVAVGIDDRTRDYTRLTGVVWYLRTCECNHAAKYQQKSEAQRSHTQNPMAVQAFTILLPCAKSWEVLTGNQVPGRFNFTDLCVTGNLAVLV